MPDEEFTEQPPIVPAEDDNTRALRRFAHNLLDKLYPQGGWRLIPHPDMGRVACIGNWPHHLFSWLLTAELPEGDGIITLGIREPKGSSNDYGFTIRRFTSRQTMPIPVRLCSLPNLNNLDPSDEAIQRATQVITECKVIQAAARAAGGIRRDAFTVQLEGRGYVLNHPDSRRWSNEKRDAVVAAAKHVLPPGSHAFLM